MAYYYAIKVYGDLVYTDDIRASAVARFYGIRPGAPSDRAAFLLVAEGLDLNADTVRRWVKVDRVAARKQPALRATPTQGMDDTLSPQAARQTLTSAGQKIVESAECYVQSIRESIAPANAAIATMERAHQAYVATTGSEPPTIAKADPDAAVFVAQSALQLRETVKQAAFIDEMLTHLICVAYRGGVPAWSIAQSANLTVSQVRRRINAADGMPAGGGRL